jgi:hypothetical protein
MPSPAPTDIKRVKKNYVELSLGTFSSSSTIGLYMTATRTNLWPNNAHFQYLTQPTKLI